MKKLDDVLERHAAMGGLPVEVIEFLRGIADLPRAKQLDKVNRYVNALKYARDELTDGVRDRWQPPAVFVERGRGDSEVCRAERVRKDAGSVAQHPKDVATTAHALMKALMLAWLGIDAWFVLCWDHQSVQWHAVAFVEDEHGEAMVLDRNPPFHRIWRQTRYEMLGIYTFQPRLRFPIAVDT